MMLDLEKDHGQFMMSVLDIGLSIQAVMVLEWTLAFTLIYSSQTCLEYEQDPWYMKGCTWL